HWVLISPFCLVNHISEEQFDLWMDHLEADRLLLTEKYTRQEAAEIQLKNDRWRERFAKELCTETAPVPPPQTKEDKRKRKKEIQRGASILHFGKGLTASFPNFCSGNQWYTNLTFGGPAI